MSIMKNRKQLPYNYLPIIDYYDKKIRSEKNKNWQMKYVFCLLLVFFVLTSSAVNTETLTAKYKIYLLGANVGEFSVAQTNNQESIIIDATTEVEIHLLFSYRIKYVQKTVYNQGVLQNAHVETYKNGKLNSTMFMKYEKGAYQLIVDGDTTIINGLITYSGSLIYFNEPQTATQIFKERNAEMRQITPAGNHAYIIKDEKGKLLNKYFYKNGILQRATMRHALATVELKRVNF